METKKSLSSLLHTLKKFFSGFLAFLCLITSMLQKLDQICLVAAKPFIIAQKCGERFYNFACNLLYPFFQLFTSSFSAVFECSTGMYKVGKYTTDILFGMMKAFSFILFSIFHQLFFVVLALKNLKSNLFHNSLSNSQNSLPQQKDSRQS